MLIGMSGTAGTMSSVTPLLWHQTIVDNKADFTTLMIIWCVLTFLSLVLCMLISPWYNLKHFPKGETIKTLVAKEMSLTSIDFVKSETSFSG